MSKCLVTGGCGFIGSNIVDRLISDGHEVIVLDNKSSDSAKFYVNEKAQYVQQDISNYQLTNTFYADVDYVFHLAAESRIGPSIDNPIETVQKIVWERLQFFSVPESGELKKLSTLPLLLDMETIHILTLKHNLMIV